MGTPAKNCLSMAAEAGSLFRGKMHCNIEMGCLHIIFASGRYLRSRPVIEFSIKNRLIGLRQPVPFEFIRANPVTPIPHECLIRPQK